MTPKEKAIELVDKMFNCDKSTPNESMAMLYPHAKQCALIAVDLLLSEMYADDYYTEVKHEIEKL
jgi:hypothetical protein